MNLIKITKLAAFFITISTYCAENVKISQYSDKEIYANNILRDIQHWNNIIYYFSKSDAFCHNICSVLKLKKIDDRLVHTFTKDIFKMVLEVDYELCKLHNVEKHYQRIYEKVYVSISFFIFTIKKFRLHKKEISYEGLISLQNKCIEDFKRLQSSFFQKLTVEQNRIISKNLNYLFIAIMERYLEYKLKNIPQTLEDN